MDDKGDVYETLSHCGFNLHFVDVQHLFICTGIYSLTYLTYLGNQKIISEEIKNPCLNPRSDIAVV